MAATKRKQQTVQFLFEASPENNITRCVISKTSNTFGNNEEGDSDDDRSAQITSDKVIDRKESRLNTYRNNELTSFMTGRRALNVDKESDGDYMKIDEQTHQSHTDKGILQEHLGSKSTRSSSNSSDGNNTMINTITVSEHISHGTTEASKFKILNDSNQKEQNACNPGELYNTNQSHKQEIRSTKTTLSARPDYENHNNFHNTIQQSRLSNPKDNDPKEQFPVKSGPKHLEARHESTKLSLNVGGKDKDLECEIINHFNAEFYDENESKYLHVIDYDMQEPVSVIRSFDYSQNTHQSAKGIGDKRSDGLSESYNGFNTTIQETVPNFLQDDNPDRQLPDLGNPRRLQGKQTKLYANIPSNDNAVDTGIENITFEGDLYYRKQPGNKVKNLVHDYELQVQENSSHHKLEEKHEDQLHLNKNAVQSPYTERHNTGTNKSLTNHVSPLNLEEPSLIESSPLHKRELGSEKIIYVSTTKASNERSTRHIPDSNSEKPPVIPSTKDLQSLEETVSESEHLKSIIATKVNNTGDIYSITREDNTSFVPDSNTSKQSPNATNTNDFKSKVGKDHSSRSDNRELRSDYEFQAGGSQVTRAHWYDIHSPLHESSQDVQRAPKEENTFTPPSREENTFTSPPSSVMYNTARGESVNEMRSKRWKSLGELDYFDQVEEYKLPEKLNKTTAYPIREQAMTDRNNNVDTMYFSTIPRNHEFNSLPRNYGIQNAQRLDLGYDGNSTETLSFNAKTVHRMPFLNNHVPNMNNDNNSEKVVSSFESNSVQAHKPLYGTRAKQAPSLTGKKYVPNMYNTSNAPMNSSSFDINSTTTLSPDGNTENQSPSIRKYIPTMQNTNSTEKVRAGFEKNGDKTLFQTSNHSPSLNKKRGKLTNYPDSSSRVSKDNLSSSPTALETLDQFPMKRSPLPTRKNEKLSRYIQKVDNSDSLLFHQISQDQANKLKDYNNNLSSSLTALETLDQSPMKRSQKIKNLVNIEYYDINSDDELNSKIKRRPRTKSLNEDDKTTEDVALKREFKSSGDLRSVGLSHDEINAGRKARERGSGVESSFVSSTRTHGKYTKLYMDSIAYGRHPQGKMPSNDSTETDRSSSHKPNPSIKVSSHDRNLDLAYKGSHVRSDNAANLTTVSKQNEGRMKRLPSLLHDTPKIDNTMKHHRGYIEGITLKSTVKSIPSPLKKFSSFATKMDNSTKQHANDIRDTTPKPIVYPIEDLKASEGKYNIAKAEEEWKKRYGRLPYNSKDPLHKSSDKEFGRLFQHSERKTTTQSSSKETGLTMNSSALQGEMDTSSSSLFSPNRTENEDEKRKNSQSKEFSTTLNQLSSYVLSGYKVDQPQTSLPNNQENTRPGITVKHKRYYSDDEGDLSHILDDPNESRKLSMLVHAIIRLREVYNIQPYTKPQTPEHPINLGNPQLRDAIENKPMSVVKDLILANKRVDINIRSQSGNSALHRAAMEGDIDAVRILINHGANVNTRDRNGFQPVHNALRCHHYKAAMFLMDCGMDLVSYTSMRIREFVNVKAIAKQYLRQTLKTPL
ncbi:Ankyrin repeat domain-containing 49 [Paramuricea clavata]|uniref:Ankyrin repeat domain-containing 49 n=1 Tax=Paramuricea clavata TaxID=317549 RepID=A0A6S7IHY6_PARCT|nr:Ankyrin repeat domain-containing 49 [Paramuricea clavata]